MKRMQKDNQHLFLPVLHASRLELRPITLWDAEDMYDYAKQQLTTKYLLWHPHKDIFETREHISHMKDGYQKGNCYDFALALKENGKMIGTCGFVYVDQENKKAEVGYVLHPAHWNKGLGTEALRAVIDFGFNSLDLRRIEARYMVENIASATVMKKAGMSFEGILRKALFVKGKHRDIGIYSILKEEHK